jgi:membrane protein DedA with SNARE-associated domain
MLSLPDWWQPALQGMAAPWVIMTVLALTTLLLEDVALAAGAALATQGLISWPLAFLAVAGGIALGDLGLYAMGWGARKVKALEARFIGPRSLALRGRLSSELGAAVLLARVVPGLRLLTYTAAGFLDISRSRFTVWVLLAVSLWTVGVFAVSVAIGSWLASVSGLSPAVAVAIPIIVFSIIVILVRAARA